MNRRCGCEVMGHLDFWNKKNSLVSAEKSCGHSV